MDNNEIKIAVLEEKIDNVSKDLYSFKKEIKRDIKEVKDGFNKYDKWHEDFVETQNKDHLSILKKITSLEEKLDKKYSAKWVEWAVKGLFVLMGTGMISLVVFFLTH